MRSSLLTVLLCHKTVIVFAALCLTRLPVILAETSSVTPILIYGATPAGISAAVAAATEGHDVLLVEPTNRIGGLVTSGLSHTDFHSRESLSGAFLDFAQRVQKHYETTYGPDSQQLKDCDGGVFAEPKVNLAVFEQMLEEWPKIRVLHQHVLKSVEMDSAGVRIRSVTFTDANGAEFTINAQVVIDASYEGDLMAMAGVPWRAGREGQSEYGETLAPEKPDDQLQAYNFRFIMTQDPANRVTPQAPAGYRREDFNDVLTALESGQIDKIFDYPRRCIFKAQRRRCRMENMMSTTSPTDACVCLCRTEPEVAQRNSDRTTADLRGTSARSGRTIVLSSER